MAVKPTDKATESEPICLICSVTNVKMHCILNSNLQEIYEILADTEMDPEGPTTVCYICYPQLKKCGAFADMAKANSILFDDDDVMDLEVDEVKPDILQTLSQSELHFMVIENTGPLHIKEEIVDDDEEAQVVKDEITVEDEQLTGQVVNPGELITIPDDDMNVKVESVDGVDDDDEDDEDEDEDEKFNGFDK